MSIAWLLCALGLALGVVMGVAMLARPRASHLSIGLGSIPEKSGGVGESRAFGGMLFGLHALALFFVGAKVGAQWRYQSFEAYAPGPELHFASLLAAGWLCAFLGRVASVGLDREGLALNARLLALDAAMTLLIAAPVLLPNL